MTRPVSFRPRAQNAIDRAARWYGQRNPQARTRFRNAIETTVASIAENPYRFERAGPRLRRALLRRFPYKLLFAVSNEAIVITDCVHQHRKPERWMGR